MNWYYSEGGTKKQGSIRENTLANSEIFYYKC